MKNFPHFFLKTVLLKNSLVFSLFLSFFMAFSPLRGNQGLGQNHETSLCVSANKTYIFLQTYYKRLLSFFPKKGDTEVPKFTKNTPPSFLGKYLWCLGYMPKQWIATPYPPQHILVRGVKNFQKAHGLDITGTLTKETLGVLNEPLSWIFDDLDYTLQQWKNLQSLPSVYIMVNIPSFTLWVFQDHNIVLESPVVVGDSSQKETMSPIFTGEVLSFVTWPLWIAPKSIQRAKGLSAKTPGYFLQGDRLVRRSGPGNPLGCIKFQTNRGGFLLHDTSSPKYFQKKQRDFSSGCIRVEKYKELLQVLCKAQCERALCAINSKKTKTFMLDVPIPLFCVYFLVSPPKSTDDFTGPYRHEDIYERL